MLEMDSVAMYRKLKKNWISTIIYLSQLELDVTSVQATGIDFNAILRLNTVP